MRTKHDKSNVSSVSILSSGYQAFQKNNVTLIWGGTGWEITPSPLRDRLRNAPHPLSHNNYGGVRYTIDI